MTDLDAINQSVYELLENGNADAAAGYVLTPQFTVATFLNALNDRQRQFMVDTGVITKRATVAVIAGQLRYDYPTDWIATRRLALQKVDGSIYSLQESDTWALDQGMANWEVASGAPLIYYDSTLETLKFEIGPPPNDIGTLQLLYIPQSTTLLGTGIVFVVPDEFAHFVIWGAMADLLGQDGEGFDPKRAAYAESRYQQGVELARTMIRGVRGQGA